MVMVWQNNMAYVYHNITLEYAPNVLEFWLYDDAGGEIPFDGNTTFSMERVDGTSSVYSVAGSVAGNKVTFSVNPPAYLKATGDTLYDFDDPSYDHIFTIRSSQRVYINGKANLVEVA